MNDAHPPSLPTRLRVTYRHGPELRYISHLDLTRVLERSLRRARLPIAYTRGFNPRPRITSAAPLPVGFSSECELADFYMEHPIEPREFADRLQRQLPPGLEILSVQEVPRTLPALPSLLAGARYVAHLQASFDVSAVQSRIDGLLASEHVVRPKRSSRRGQGEYDLRPLILSLDASQENGSVDIHMLLSARPGATGRPEEVLEALRMPVTQARITRLTLIFEGMGAT